jgi:hypothetical protein
MGSASEPAPMQELDMVALDGRDEPEQRRRGEGRLARRKLDNESEN